MFDLEALGWDDRLSEEFEAHRAAGLVPGRVAVQHRGAWDVLTEAAELRCDAQWRLSHEAESPAELPVVGDWVAVDARPDGDAGRSAPCCRDGRSSRARPPGRPTEEQVLAANVDVVFIVSSLNEDLNLRRLERYLTLGWESGARPVIVLTKADLADDVPAKLAEVESIAVRRPGARDLEQDRRRARRSPARPRAGRHGRIARAPRASASRRW